MNKDINDAEACDRRIHQLSNLDCINNVSRNNNCCATRRLDPGCNNLQFGGGARGQDNARAFGGKSDRYCFSDTPPRTGNNCNFIL
jgi:hypothetical protein